MCSVLAIYLGYWLCSYDAVSMSMKCGDIECTFQERQPGNVYSDWTVSRRDFVSGSADQVRVNKVGEVVDVEKLNRRQKRKLLYSYQVLYNDVDANGGSDSGQQYSAVFGKFGVGRKRSKKQAQKIALYLDGEVNTLSLKESKVFTFRGAMTMILGFFSFLLCIVFGQFDDPKRKFMGPGSNNFDYKKYSTNANANGRW